MKLIKYNDYNDYVPTRWGSLLDSFLSEQGFDVNKTNKFVPSVDIIENAEAFELHMAAPGMKKDDFQIEIEENNLIVSGERKWKEEEKEKNFHRVETQFGAFRRSFTLPQNILVEKISANYNDGILEIEIPKDAKKEMKSIIKVK